MCPNVAKLQYLEAAKLGPALRWKDLASRRPPSGISAGFGHLLVPNGRCCPLIALILDCGAVPSFCGFFTAATLARGEMLRNWTWLGSHLPPYRPRTTDAALRIRAPLIISALFRL